MRTVTLNRVFLSNSFIINCQIASLLAVIFLLSDIADASELAVEPGIQSTVMISNVPRQAC